MRSWKVQTCLLIEIRRPSKIRNGRIYATAEILKDHDRNFPRLGRE